MPLNEENLRALLAEQDKSFKRHVDLLQEDFKRHVGVLLEETDRKIDLLHEGFQGLSDKVDQLREEVASIRKELEQLRLHLFRKADVERLDALERRVAAVEERLSER